MTRFLQQVFAVRNPFTTERASTPGLKVQTHLKAGRDDSKDKHDKETGPERERRDR